ncbi:MAG: lipopolysaccharide transport periplasmic protein LptA [Mariprofundaceae bacterium]
MKKALLILICFIMPATWIYAEPITVQADRLEVQHNQHRAIFQGHVHLVRDDLELFSQKLEVYYHEQKEGIQQAMASGNVRIKQEELSGHADNATLDNTTQKLILSGNAVMNHPDGKMRGDHIEYHLDSRTIRVSSDPASKTRVHLHVNEEGVK